MDETLAEKKRQDALLRATLFAFFVSGAASQPLGSFIPFLRETYGFSYDLSGVLLSCQSVGNLAAILLTGFLPYAIGRRRSILLTSVWMAVAYLIFASGLGATPLLIAAFLMTGVSRGGNSNFSNTMISTLPGERATRGYQLLHGCFAVGALLSPLLLVFCTTRLPGVGWRVVAGVLCALCVAQIVTYLKMPLPRENGRRSVKRIDNYLAYRGKMEELANAEKNQDTARIKKIMNRYLKTVERYRNLGLAFYINDELEHYAELVWKKQKGKKDYGSWVRSNTPDVYKKKDLEVYLKEYM